MPNGIGAMTSAQAAAAGQAALAAGRAAIGGGAPTGQGIGIGADVTARVTRAQPPIGPTPTPTPAPSWLGTTGWDAFMRGLSGPLGVEQWLPPSPFGGGGRTTATVQQPIGIGESVTAKVTTAEELAAAEAGERQLTFIPEVGWGYWYQDSYGEWHFELVTPVTAAGGMSEYESAYLDFMQQQAATQEAARQQEYLAALAADPSRWIELSQYTTQQPGTVPEWLSGIYEGQVPAGAPLGEAREVGPVPQLSKQWWDWLSPAEREKLKGYMTWINMEPEDWMSRQWWMRGQQPYGMGQQFAPFRQYG